MSLNKQRVLEGMFCQRALWLRAHKPELHPTQSGYDRLTMERGSEAGRRARAYFPDGQLIALGDNMVAQTARAIAAGVATLFEATFEHNGVLIRTDILTRLPDDKWHLIEVKGGSHVKPKHYADAAVQLSVLQAAGLSVTQVSLMHMDGSADYADFDRWFSLADISAEVTPLLPAIVDIIPSLIPVLQLESQPKVQLGTHCTKCDFQPHCWQHLGNKGVYSIPNLRGPRLTALQELNIEHLDDLPDSFVLTKKQRAFVDALYDETPDEPHIEVAAIRSALSELQFPIHFFDFEADAPFLPQYANSSPHSRIPYQFSCHTLHENGQLTHQDYLHSSADDPRPNVTNAMSEALGEQGSIVVYSAGYEKAVLHELARRLPQHANHIERIIGRLWDQLVIFKKHYHDPAFNGSNSLKSVLPALVPALDYAQEAISDGTASVTAWQRLVTLPAGDEREQLIADLRSYCRLDTQAMVELHYVLSALDSES